MLSNNGGPTQTHALLPGSPRSAGNNTPTNNAGLTTDQRGSGFNRIADGPDADTTDTVDIGAFEAQLSLEDITDKATNEDTQLQFTFNVGGAANITSVTATSANTTLVPNNAANIDVSGSGSTRTLTINPAAELSGTSTITVTVSGSSETVTDTFDLTVNAVNDVPSFIKGTNQTVNEDAGAQSAVNWATSISPGPNEGGQTVSFTATNDNNALSRPSRQLAERHFDLHSGSERQRLGHCFGHDQRQRRDGQRRCGYISAPDFYDYPKSGRGYSVSDQCHHHAQQSDDVGPRNQS